MPLVFIEQFDQIQIVWSNYYCIYDLEIVGIYYAYVRTYKDNIVSGYETDFFSFLNT